MKFNPTATGNAFAFTTGVFFVACRVLVGAFPDLMFAIAQSWFHGVALTKFDSGSLSVSAFVIGLVSSMVLTWITGYIFAKVYNLMKS